MKIKSHFLFLIIFILSVGSTAQAYKMVNTNEAVSDQELTQIDRIFVELGYDVYKNRKNFNVFPGLDRVYTKNKMREKIFFKTSVTIENQKSAALLKFANGYLTNVKIHNLSNVLYFSGYDPEEIKKLKTQLHQKNSVQSFWSHFIFQKVNASDSACANSSSISPEILKNENAAIQNTYGCVAGYWEGTKDAVKEVGRFAKSTFGIGEAEKALMIYRFCSKSSPQKNKASCEEWDDSLYSASEKSFSQVTDSIKAIYIGLQQVLPGFKKLSTQDQWKLGCKVGSQILLLVGPIVATRGGSSTRITTEVVEGLKKINLAKFELPTEIVAEINNVARKPRNILQFLSKGNPQLATQLENDFYEYSLARSLNINATSDFEGFKISLTEFNEVLKLGQAAEKGTWNSELVGLVDNFSKLSPKEINNTYRILQTAASESKVAFEKASVKYRESLSEANKTIYKAKEAGLTREGQAVALAQLAFVTCTVDQSYKELHSEVKESNSATAPLVRSTK